MKTCCWAEWRFPPRSPSIASCPTAMLRLVVETNTSIVRRVSATIVRIHSQSIINTNIAPTVPTVETAHVMGDLDLDVDRDLDVGVIILLLDLKAQTDAPEVVAVVNVDHHVSLSIFA